MIRTPELLIILGILVLLFGSSKLPALGSSIGSAIRNFKKGFAGDEEEAKRPQGALGAAKADVEKMQSDERSKV